MADAKTVEVMILDEKKKLRPTLGAAKLVNSAFSGFSGAYEKIQRLDSDAMVLIIGAGLNLSTPRDVKKLEEDMYETGFFNFIGPAREFVTLLASGGKGQSAASADEGDASKNA